MMLMLVVQVALGIVTVMHGAPWPIAILHQLGAVALFTLIIRARFAALYPRSAAHRPRLKALPIAARPQVPPREEPTMPRSRLASGTSARATPPASRR